MHKTDLIDAVAAESGLPKATVAKALDATLEVIMSNVAKGDAVTLTGFGAFKATQRAARTGKNPRTGEALKIAASTAPKFTPGSVFKTKVGG